MLEVSPEEVRDRIRDLHEANPMLGHRGSRLAVTAPEIYTMQLRALFGAMQDVAGTEAATVEIMLPLISTAGEITRLRQLIETEAAAWSSTHGFTPNSALAA